MKFNLALTAAAVMLASAAYASTDNPLWIRNNSISPDGKSICFTYKGDVFTVGKDGGQARQITSNRAFDSYPIWSPDSKTIVFSSDRKGSADLYAVSAEGGEPRRLTTHSAAETPVAFLNDSTVIFKASISPDVNDAQFPNGYQLYTVTLSGGRPRLFSSVAMENISVGKDGKTILYHDVKGYEDNWRKHHTSSVTRDIWMCTVGSNGRPEGFTKLSDFKGEDRNPVWDGNDAYFYLSEQDGSFNVYRRKTDGEGNEQITFHKNNPVRFLSLSSDGILCYNYDGQLFTAVKGADGKWNESKVNVSIVRDPSEVDMSRFFTSMGASEFSVSPDETEIAFIYRGDVFVTSVEYETTKRITNTPEQERSVSFSPDGRSLVYASERDGLWQIYTSEIVRDEDKQFCYAAEIKEEKVTDNGETSFQPAFSPDGKEIAFLKERSGISVINLKNKKERVVMDKKFQYSYADGDQWYQWSPDGNWILTDYIGTGGWNNKDVALVKADGSGEIHNLTESGYTDGNARWVLGGKAMIWFSDMAGYRSHGSWGAQNDVYIMFFDREAYEKFTMDEEQLKLFEQRNAEKGKKSEKKEGEEDKEKDADKKEDKKVKPLELDLENCRDRVVRLTVNSSFLIDAYLTADGNKLFYITTFEGTYDMWCHDLKEHSTTLFLKNVGASALESGNSGNNLYMSSRGQLKKINLMTSQSTPITFSADFEFKPELEREYIFNHVWKQVKDKFYVEDLHGVDWDMYRETYKKFLPHINNDRDFADMLSELLGELNASHTGARYMGGSSAIPTANFGVFFDNDYEGDGLKIAEIIRRSPMSIYNKDITEGCIIEEIEGTKILSGMDYFPLLEGKAGDDIRVKVYNPKKKKRFETYVKGISSGALNGLLYRRWVDRNEETVKKLSDGRVAYVHIQGMDSPSFRELYKNLLGKYRNCEAVIVDTRHNGGGWLHDDVLTLLSGKEYQKFVAHGQFIGNDPFNKWCKPSCMMICEDNYSNAHGTPALYKQLGIGKLVGSPTPGTMTAVWWEVTLNPAILFGIPQVGCVTPDGEYAENRELEPDILVYNSPEKIISGTDEQLEKAVSHMLEVIGQPEGEDQAASK